MNSLKLLTNFWLFKGISCSHLKLPSRTPPLGLSPLPPCLKTVSACLSSIFVETTCWLVSALRVCPSQAPIHGAFTWVKGHAKISHTLYQAMLATAHFTDAESEAQRGWMAARERTGREWQIPVWTWAQLTLTPMLGPSVGLPSAPGPWTDCWTSVSLGFLLSSEDNSYHPHGVADRVKTLWHTVGSFSQQSAHDTISRPLPFTASHPAFPPEPLATPAPTRGPQTEATSLICFI